MGFNHILLDVDADGIALITFNRPEKRNALNQAMLRDLGDVVLQIESEPHIRAFILTGAGDKAFVAGADISELAELDALGTSRKGLSGQAIMRRLEPSAIATGVCCCRYGIGCSGRSTSVRRAIRGSERASAGSSDPASCGRCRGIGRTSPERRA